MSSANNPNPKPSWWKDILNGIVAWITAFAIYVVPAFAVGISMGFDLGPKLRDNAEVSRRVSEAVSEMYRSGWYLHIGFIVVLAIVVFWRAWARTRLATEKSILHGAAIGATAAILAAVQMVPNGAGVHAGIAAVVCIVAGLMGGRKREPQHTAE